MLGTFSCSVCGVHFQRENGQANRTLRLAGAIYCSKICSGQGRRIERSDAEKRALKADYDRQYRAENADMLRSKKAKHHRETYDPAQAAIVRKNRMPKHVEYCRRPGYRKWKAEYDKKYCARKGFGDFGEAAIILNQLEAEIASRASRVEISRANGTLNKHQARRRDYERQTQRG